MPTGYKIPNRIQACGHWCRGHWQRGRRCCACSTQRKGMLKTDWDYVTLMRFFIEECCDTCQQRSPDHYDEAKTFIDDYDAGNYDVRAGEE